MSVLDVRCPTCLRTERWTDGERQVIQEGGSRQPALEPRLAAWNTARAAREAGHVVVGHCPCGQPLVAAEGTWLPWTVETPQGSIRIGPDGQTGPKGEIPDEQMQTSMEGWFGPRFEVRPFQWAFQATAMLSLVAPALLWLAALITVIFILTGLLQRPGFR